MHGATVVFDLDGTLIDTAPDLVRATNFSLHVAGLPPVPAEVITPHVGHGAKRMIIEALRAHGETREDAIVEELLAAYLAYYAENIAIDSRPYPGVISEIEALREAGAKIAICTNKREDMSRRLIAALDLDHHFTAIVGRDTLPVCKPDPLHLLQTIAMSGGNPQKAVMIGDTQTDIATARAAVVPVIAVSFGYSPVPVKTFQPDLVIEAYDGLTATITSLLA